MNSKHIGADLNFAWPTAEIAVMGAQGASEIIFKREIAGSEDPRKTHQEKIDEYTHRFANPYIAAERGFIDEVILPRNTRVKVKRAFEMLRKQGGSTPEKRNTAICLFDADGRK